MRLPERQRETERQKARNHPPGGMATLQSLLLHSPLGILGMHAHTPDMSSKPPGPGLKPQSTTWESSDIAITLTAGPSFRDFFSEDLLAVNNISLLFYYKCLYISPQKIVFLIAQFQIDSYFLLSTLEIFPFLLSKSPT